MTRLPRRLVHLAIAAELIWLFFAASPTMWLGYWGIPLGWQLAITWGTTMLLMFGWGWWKVERDRLVVREIKRNWKRRRQAIGRLVA